MWFASSPEGAILEVMASKASYDYEIDVRTLVTTLLQLSPIILVVTYILEYSYVFQFLAEFDVTPEEIGISEIELLSRAALLTLTVITAIGLISGIAVGLAVIESSVVESSTARRILIKVRPTKVARSRKQSSIMLSIQRASQQAQSIRDVSAASFGLIFLTTIFGMKPLGIQLSIFAKVVCLAAAAILTFILFSRWRDKRTRYLTLTCGVAIEVSLLCIAVIAGGVNTGVVASTTGNIPTFVNLLGVNIFVVRPVWLDAKIAPPRYSQNQDFLEVGSDDETAYIYDCKTFTTYRVPLNDIVLQYQVWNTASNSSFLGHLYCSPPP